MPLAPPVALPIRLRWQPPAGGLPGWAEACAALLDTPAELAWGATQAAPGQAPGDIEKAAQAANGTPWTDTDIVLCLDDASAAAQTQSRCWLLTGGDGKTLAHRRPLLDDLTNGRGIALALWQSSHPSSGWTCIRRLHVSAPMRYGRGVRGLPRAAAWLLHQACMDVQLGAAPAGLGIRAPEQGPAPAAGAIRQAWLLLRGLYNGCLAVQRARWNRELWRIGVIDAPLSSLLAAQRLPPVRWLDAPPGMGYWADPMGGAGRSDELFCEYFDEPAQQGHIERLRLGENGEVIERTPLPLGGGKHTSFPLVMEFAGRRLGLVETAALRECVLHEVDDAGHWRPLNTLLPGVAAADPALFHWGQRWWLAYTDLSHGATNNLCLQHAPALEGPWQPHANNPVRVDVTGSRMAGGLFWHEGSLYRPAQDCLATYGASMKVHKVLRCTPTEYEEQTVRLLQPDPQGPCPDGMHTLSAWGDRTLIDGKRLAFSPYLLWLKLLRRLGLSARPPAPVASAKWPPANRR